MTQIIIRMAKLGKENLSRLLDGLQVPVEENEVRFRILSEDFRAVGEAFIKSWTAHASASPGYTAAEDNYEGIRFSTGTDVGDGWILVRLSVHDPVIVINAESNTTGGTLQMLRTLYEFTKSYTDIDYSKLTALLNA